MASLDKGTDPSKLTEGGGTEIKPREFFWDSVIIYLLSVILALSAVDALTEFIRGTGVTCITKNGEATGDYVNNFCAGSLPITEYIPAYIFIHGLAIGIPHFLWLATYGGQFDYFFSIVSSLDTSRELTSGKYSKGNYNSVRQLEVAFTTYKRNAMYWLYLGKLSLQLVFALASLVLTVIYFTDFDVIFPCPRDDNGINTTSFPEDDKVTCVFTSLKLLFWIRIADVVLLTLVVFSMFWAFWFCLRGHPTELGADKVAQFSFHSGIQPNLYVSSSWYCPRCLSHIFVRFFPLPLTSPMVTTDMDFLLLKLFHTNAGLGSVVKDIQIDLRIEDYANGDLLRLNLHKEKHNQKKHISFKEDDPKTNDLRWKFPKGNGAPSSTSNFNKIKKTIHNVPNSVRGFVLGMSSRAESNTGALSISFGHTGFGLALRRVFPRVGSINFTEFKKEFKAGDSEEVAKQLITVGETSSVFSVTAPDDVIVGDYSDEVLPIIDQIWFEVIGNDETEENLTSFIVVGPIASEDQASTVTLFLEKIEDRLDRECVLLSLKPVKIEGKNTKKQFFDWEPPTESFSSEKLEISIDTENVLTWPKPGEVHIPTDTHPLGTETLICGSSTVEFVIRLYTRAIDQGNNGGGGGSGESGDCDDDKGGASGAMSIQEASPLISQS